MQTISRFGVDPSPITPTTALFGGVVSGVEPSPCFSIFLARTTFVLESLPEAKNPGQDAIFEDFSKNILLRRVEFGIWLKHHRKIWNFTRRSRVKFQIFLWCLKAKFQIPLSAEGCLLLTPRHLWNLTKICGVWVKFSQIFKICENLAQTPQILVKFHRFWVVISGGEWCYELNISQLSKCWHMCGC